MSAKSGKILGKALARAFLNRSTRNVAVDKQSHQHQQSSFQPQYAVYGIAASLLFAGGFITASSLLSNKGAMNPQKHSVSSTSTSPTTTTTSPTTTTSLAPPTSPLEQEALILGGSAPSTVYRRVSENFVAEYDTLTRNPRWVIERITAKSLNEGGGVSRHKFQFHEDTSIPVNLRARLSDYEHSGYDRGHLSSAADNRSSEVAMKDSFLLTNISPQVGEGFNRDYWARFERFVRNLSRSFKTVYVCTGPLFLPTPTYSSTSSSPSSSSSKSFSMMQDGVSASVSSSYRYSHSAIGNPLHWIQVPTHFFKVIVCTDANDQPTSAAAFVMPNANINADEALINFAVTLQSVEAASGLRFFREMITTIEEFNAPLDDKNEDLMQQLQNNKPALVDLAGLNLVAPSNGHERAVRHVCQFIDCSLPPAYEAGRKK